MNNAIYLRPLMVDDAKVSGLRQANEDIWKYAHFKTNNIITKAIEINGLRKRNWPNCN